MKNIMIVVLIVWTYNSYSQANLQAHYTIYYNTEVPTSKKAILYTEASKYTYIEGVTSQRKVDSKLEENQIFVKPQGSETYNQTDISRDSVYSKVYVRGRLYKLKEPKPTFDWVLTNEQKTIDTYKVKKAILSFRGRDYVAWYSEDIPINAGPWKFSGLPGLIFEIQDTSGRYNWQLTKLITNKNATPPLPDCDNCPSVDLKNYCFLSYEKKFTQGGILRSLPRGTTSTVHKILRNGIEIAFEWEN